MKHSPFLPLANIDLVRQLLPPDSQPAHGAGFGLPLFAAEHLLGRGW